MKGVQFVPGGATQNSMRVAQWLLQVPRAVAYMGCVGSDKYVQDHGGDRQERGRQRAPCQRLHVPACTLGCHDCRQCDPPGVCTTFCTYPPVLLMWPGAAEQLPPLCDSASPLHQSGVTLHADAPTMACLGAARCLDRCSSAAGAAVCADAVPGGQGHADRHLRDGRAEGRALPGGQPGCCQQLQGGAHASDAPLPHASQQAHSMGGQSADMAGACSRAPSQLHSAI